ncbi:TPA: hydrogenase maturation nickel metallochaperone HypA [Pseudomonas aeruginosa]|uniref:Hydrogenase maturation factor HypA n=1 Tax=Pseudomonas citronellolis TaxID=53408 RepID=A0A1A9KFG2_9PSED|nr:MULTISPECIES: hydrogenase maturation nickel metallochaperone HypA [Pseudomonas]ANI16254.1 hydrogenase nickel incorporation protein HypA [Pseudomonas citronellolis]EJU9614710.1 hydrogenase maturation nickel metallochaperone HypA [Pseudomonas aeruginosa]EKU2929948.1 hydrogenase maturation nickel metallochaperone HypA [Pseudomonas aeruginosa]EKX3870072.1 hydrogenase maturation nickel metallochaperone HypA [Pseudomonas aeruginosa]ELM0223580.1 hydrogenase maturation nickel metallochaperone HypA 
MHEVSLAGGILAAVEDAARQDPFVRVSRLRLEAGQLAGVEVEALRFALQAIAPGSLLDGAHIEIEQPDGQAWCLDCATHVALPQRGAACPHCGGFWLQPTAGTELRILDLQVEDY